MRLVNADMAIGIYKGMGTDQLSEVSIFLIHVGELRTADDKGFPGRDIIFIESKISNIVAVNIVERPLCTNGAPCRSCGF